MKAIVLKQAGGVENFIIKDIEKPEIKENEVLISVKAISINPVDFKVRVLEDFLNSLNGADRPAIIGWDISGAIVAIGNNVTKFEIGDNVFGMVNFPGSGKAYAEFVAAPEDQLAKIPKNISFNEAAATTLAALTALQALKPRVKKGDRVLIHGGSGGVGHFAIQIAKSLGAHVISTSSAKNKSFILSLGADEHIDYTSQKFEEILTDVDFVLDMFNEDILLNSIKVTKKGGTIISLPTADFSDEILKLAKERNVDLSFTMVQSNGDDMNTLKNMLESEAIKPHVSKTFAFEKMGDAHLHLEIGRTVGKVILTMK
jgi:NADPH:quinone reductase-like Zn-dependent oxidoreductase